MSKTKIVLGSLMFLFFAVLGVFVMVKTVEKITEINDSHPVTARLSGYTTRIIEETDGDYGTKTRTQYRCTWEYEVGGQTFTRTLNQYSKPSSTTTLYINNGWPYNVVTANDEGYSLCVGLVLFSLGLIGLSLAFLRAVYVEIKWPGTSMLSRIAEIDD